MKLSLLAALVSLSLVGLGACASVDRQSHSSAMQPGSLPSTQSADIRQLYIAKVERMAKRRGIEVMWVNPPVFAEQQAMETPTRD